MTCIVDGDTLWLQGEKLRLRGVDTPEVDGRCRQERVLARQATDALRELLFNQQFVLRRHGTDRFGRTLADIGTNAGDIGAVLMVRGLADRFGDGVRTDWCR